MILGIGILSAGNSPAKSQLVEERVVLVRARNHDEAIRRAEKEAGTYAADTCFRNRFG